MAVVRGKNGELADLAEQAAHDAERLLANAKRALRTARTKAAQLKAARGTIRSRVGGGAGWPGPSTT